MEKARYRVTIEALEPGDTVDGKNSTATFEGESVAVMCNKGEEQSVAYVAINIIKLAEWYANDKKMQMAARLSKVLEAFETESEEEAN